MENSQTRFRSISLPTKLPSSTNATIPFDSKAFLTTSSEGIQSSLMELAKLYNSIEQLVQSPANQKSLEESTVLEGSVELIDSCNNIRELFQLIRENVQTLQSALRRKGQDSTIQNDIATYFSIRKIMNKSLSKSLKSLKKFETKINGSNASVNPDNKLREVMGVTTAFFKSILEYLSCHQMAKSGGWSLVSKLMITKSEKEVNCASEVANVDIALNSYLSKIKNNGVGILDLKMMLKKLKNLDDCIGGIELRLDKLFSQLIQSRVAILNNITQH